MVKRTRILMGTVVEIQVRGISETNADAAITGAFDEIKRIDREFSSFDKESSVWEINHSSDSVIKVIPEIYKIIRLSDSLWEKSGGAFDASLESLTEAWGFNGNDPSVPDEKKRLNALFCSGWKNIRLLGNNKILRSNAVGFNFGAIAKGYAVDRALEILKENGVKECLVNAGGEIRAEGNEWIIGVRHPRKENEIIAKLKLNGMSVATSGDYEQFFIKNGKRYDHIINPVTGFPSDDCQSVTVIADNDTEADGLSTAVFVLGPLKGMKLIDSLPGIEAMIIDSSGKMLLSPGFKNYLLR